MDHPLLFHRWVRIAEFGQFQDVEAFASGDNDVHLDDPHHHHGGRDYSPSFQIDHDSLDLDEPSIGAARHHQSSSNIPQNPHGLRNSLT